MTSMEHARIVLILIPINEWSPFFMEDHETTGLLQTKTYFMEYVRWTMTCCGCYECSNLNCSFIKHYESSNKLQLNKNDFSCNVCGTTGEFKSSPATKVQQFDVVYSKVTIFQTGNHTCDAKKTFEPSSEICEKFIRDWNITATKALKTQLLIVAKRKLHPGNMFSA